MASYGAGRLQAALGSLKARSGAPRSSLDDLEAVHNYIAVQSGAMHRLQKQSSVDTRHAGHPPLSALDTTDVATLVRQLNPLYLRDCCTCPLCVDPSSGQKNVWTVDLPADIAIKTATPSTTGKDEVQVTWTAEPSNFPASHVSTYTLSDLRFALHTQTRPPARAAAAWNRASITKSLLKMDYASYLTSRASLHAVLSALRADGLVLLTDVPESEQSVIAAATALGPLRNSFYGLTWDVRSVPRARNVAYTSRHLGFHMDLLYMAAVPKLQLLHCLRSSAAGGASLFSDALRGVQGLFAQEPGVVRDMARLSTTFHYRAGGKHYRQSRPLVRLDAAGRAVLDKGEGDIVPHVENVYWSPPFQGPFGARDEGDVQRWHEVARRFRDVVEDGENVFEHMLRPGECFIFDNTRVLHARTAFDVADAGKERWLKGAYVDNDPYESQLRVMDAEAAAGRQ